MPISYIHIKKLYRMFRIIYLTSRYAILVWPLLEFHSFMTGLTDAIKRSPTLLFFRADRFRLTVFLNSHYLYSQRRILTKNQQSSFKCLRAIWKKREYVYKTPDSNWAHYLSIQTHDMGYSFQNESMYSRYSDLGKMINLFDLAIVIIFSW